MTKYEFKEVTKEDIPKILKLFSESYPNESKFSKDYLLWQYFKNPNGKVIGYNAWYDNEIAAHYSVIPTVFEKKNVIYNACQSLNTATSPYYQHKGLFTKLANLTYDKASMKGYDFVYASANNNSIGGFLGKLDFELLGRIGIFFGYYGNTIDHECLKQKYSDKASLWRLNKPGSKYYICKDGIYVKKKLSNKKKNIKNYLLDQKFVSGIGNIYASEILFLSKIKPNKKVKFLNKIECILLIKNIKKILKNAIKKGGSSIRDFKNTDGNIGSFQDNFKVYQREGLACKRKNCKGKIIKKIITNRSTFFCNFCQK